MMGENITYQLIESREDHQTLIVIDEKGTWPLHSKMYPSREAASLEKELEPGVHDILIVLGTGLGYHLVPLKKHLSRYRLILCIDFLTGLEEHVARDNLTVFLTGSRNVHFILGKDIHELQAILDSLIDFSEIRGIRVVEHPASMRIFPEYYTGVRSAIQSMINRKAGSGATVRAFGPLFMRNIIKMLGHMEGFFPVRSLFGLCAGMPVLIVTPGPSLEKSLDRIREHAGRFFIIAVDSALPVLQQARIVPDICISIDPQPYIAEHFQDVSVPDVLFVVSVSSNPLVLTRIKCRRTWLSLNSHPLSQVLEELHPGVVGSVDSGTGSVAGDALCLAVSMGFSTIALAGFDFSFINYDIYARGTAYQRRYTRYFQNRLSPVETANFNYVMKSSRGFRHDGIFSRKAFIHYRDRLEDYIVRAGKGRIYRLHGSRIGLRGAADADMEDFLGECPPAVDKSALAERAAGRLPGLDSLLSRERILSLLGDRDVFDEVMRHSLGEGRDTRRERAITKLRDLLK
ncbi:MAG: hypothetical protein CVV44_10985 [Spirochaetae bacterium HGW-Spirochaetae-1]|jgi:hypothetical protein|nr:MAG: hypothetical protein CVV44_10985 [Spirochaetae bacterium HGW-Spirochaetae-1]